MDRAPVAAGVPKADEMGDPARFRSRERRWPLVVALAAVVVLASCEAGTPAARSASPTATPANPSVPVAVATPSAAPSRSGWPTPPTSVPTPAPTPSGPTASDAMLAPLYAALRPVNLRSFTGSRTFVRGEDVRLAYEMVNAGTGSVVIPTSVYANRPAGWVGIVQTWIERLGTNTDLGTCLPTAARSGRRYAMSGMPATLGVSGFAVEPGQGRTLLLGIPTQWTRCFPPGRYRASLEYRRIEDRGQGSPIASAAVDIDLVNPSRWSTQVAVGGIGSATLVTSAGGSKITSSVQLSQVQPGTKYTFEVRLGCDRDGVMLIPPVTFRADASGAYRDVRTVSVSAAARTALGSGQSPAAWWFSNGYGACITYAGAPAAVPAGRSPTTWGGPLLRESLGAGFAVIASAMAIRPGDGRPSQAFDGDVNRTWNSGFGAPAWIEIDLGRDRLVGSLRLLPSQLPSPAATTHRIYGRRDGQAAETLLATLEGVTTDNVWLTIDLPKAGEVRYLRIETGVSPSTIAWREIEIPGILIPHPSRMPVGTHDGTTLAFASGPSCQAVGWTSDPDAATDVTIRVLVDGMPVTTSKAGLLRSDVAAAGAGDATSGFAVDLRPYVTLDVRHEIRIQAQDLETGRWVDLNSTPRRLICTR